MAVRKKMLFPNYAVCYGWMNLQRIEILLQFGALSKAYLNLKSEKLCWNSSESRLPWEIPNTSPF